MATMLQSPAVGQGRCMKYKRKFYQADDYLPWSHTSRMQGDKVRDPDASTSHMTPGSSTVEPSPPVSRLGRSENESFPRNPEVNNNTPSVEGQQERTDIEKISVTRHNSPNKRAKMTPEYQGVGLSIPDSYSSGMTVDTHTKHGAFLSGPENSTVQDLGSLLNCNLWRTDSALPVTTSVHIQDGPSRSAQSINFLSLDQPVNRCQVNHTNSYFETSQIMPTSQSGSRQFNPSSTPSSVTLNGSHVNQISAPQAHISTNQSNNISQVIFVPIVTSCTAENTVQIATSLPAVSFDNNNVASQPSFNLSSVFSTLAPTLALASGQSETKKANETGLQFNLQIAPPQNDVNLDRTLPIERVGLPDDSLTTLDLSQMASGARHAEPDTTMSRPQTQQQRQWHGNHLLSPSEMAPNARRYSTSDDSVLSDSESTCTASTVSVGSTSTSTRSPESFVGMTLSGGVKRPTSLFPRPAKGRSLWEIVDIMARRHQDGYYIGWSAEKILELPPNERPNVFPVTPRLRKDLVSKSVLTENKKLAFSFFSKEVWGHTFRQNLRNGFYKTLSDAKRDASQLWRENCPENDGSRVVRMRDTAGNIVMKRTRQQSGSEFEYRQGLRKAKVSSIVDQIWAKRSVIADALQSSTFEALCREMRSELTDYQLPKDEKSRMADVVAFSLRKELLAANVDKVQ